MNSTTRRPINKYIPTARYRQPKCTTNKFTYSNNRNSSRHITLLNSTVTWSPTWGRIVRLRLWPQCAGGLEWRQDARPGWQGRQLRRRRRLQEAGMSGTKGTVVAKSLLWLTCRWHRVCWDCWQRTGSSWQIVWSAFWGTEITVNTAEEMWFNP